MAHVPQFRKSNHADHAEPTQSVDIPTSGPRKLRNLHSNMCFHILTLYLGCECERALTIEKRCPECFFHRNELPSRSFCNGVIHKEEMTIGKCPACDPTSTKLSKGQMREDDELCHRKLFETPPLRKTITYKPNHGLGPEVEFLLQALKLLHLKTITPRARV